MKRKTESRSKTPPNKGVLTGMHLENERARELQYMQRAILSTNQRRDGSMNPVRTSEVKVDVVGEYARFREHMDEEMLSFDFGEPPLEALKCGVSNRYLPLNPDVDDIKQWRLDNEQFN